LIVSLKEYILSSLKAQKVELSKYGVHVVGLFGSYSRNEQTNQSNIDLENFDKLMAVYDLFESLFENERVEVVTKNGNGTEGAELWKGGEINVPMFQIQQ